MDVNLRLLCNTLIFPCQCLILFLINIMTVIAVHFAFTTYATVNWGYRKSLLCEFAYLI